MALRANRARHAGSIAMQQFIPFEDEWDMLDAAHPAALIPYRVGLLRNGQRACGQTRSIPATLPMTSGTPSSPASAQPPSTGDRRLM